MGEIFAASIDGFLTMCSGKVFLWMMAGILPGMFFGLVADFTETIQNMEEQEAQGTVGAILTSLARNLTSKTYLTGISDTLRAVVESDRYMDHYLNRLAGAHPPGRSVPDRVRHVRKLGG